MTEPHEHLIANYLRGTLSPEESLTFEVWLKESEDNLKLVNDFKRIWEISDDKAESIDFQKEEEWSRLQAVIHRENNKIPIISIKSHALKIAAAIIFLLVSSFILYRVVFRSTEIIHETANQRQHIILPDGSEVWLNEKSSLAYQSDFGEARSLRLQGEGFFEVKPNPERPFVIHTNETQIKVLGTSFNVKAYRDEKQIEVFVVTGKVSFSPIGDKNIVLTPGFSGIFNRDNHTVMQKRDSNLNIMAWKDRQLVFRKTPLREVVKTLGSYFKIDIEVKNNEILNCRFTTFFNNPTLPEVLEELRLALNLKIDHQHDNVYSLDGEGCNIY